MPQLLMPKATAVWLIDNTTLTFEQIAEFTGLHSLEITGIADGEVAQGIKGFDPIANNQLTRGEIERCEKDPKARLRQKSGVKAPEQKKKAPRYTPLSKRQDRPAAIAWLVRNHPELADAQISKLLGTTKQTIQAIRDKTHWNSANIVPVDPVALGLCRQIDLDAAVAVAAERIAREEPDGPVAATMRERLMSTEESLNQDQEESRPLADLDADALFQDRPAAFDEPEPDETPSNVDPDAFFNLPKNAEDPDDDMDDRR